MSKEYQRNVIVQSSVPSNTEPWLFDGFESLLSWADVGSVNATAAVTRVNTASFEGAASMLIDTGGTNPLANDEILVERYAVVGSSRYVEYSGVFAIVNANTKEVIRLYSTIGHSGEAWDFRFEISTITGLVKYYNASEVFTTITGLTFSGADERWIYFRAVYDVVLGQYISFQLNDKIIKLNNAQAFSQGTVSIGTVTLDIYLKTTEAVRKQLRVDNILLRGIDNV